MQFRLAGCEIEGSFSIEVAAATAVTLRGLTVPQLESGWNSLVHAGGQMDTSDLTSTILGATVVLRWDAYITALPTARSGLSQIAHGDLIWVYVDGMGR